MNTLKIGNTHFTIPDGYQHAHWADVSNNDTVYIIGTHNFEPRAYGPFKVRDKRGRVLLSGKGRVFIESCESLLVKVGEL